MTPPESESDEDSDDESNHTARSCQADVTVEAPPVEAAEYLAAWWVSLADEQRVYNSHLLGEPNRALIREAMARHIVTDGLLVARVPRQGGRNTGDTNDIDDANDEIGVHDRRNAIGENWALRPEGDEDGTLGVGNREVMDGRAGNTATHTAVERAAGAGEGVIVGFVMFGPETGSYDQSVDRGIIENVYVHPDYRNRGIGAALLDAAERALVESGVDVIALEAMADNEAARRLYARRGYRPHRVELEAPIEDLESLGQGADERHDDEGKGDDSGGGSRDAAPGGRRPETDRKR